jgi:3-deoxy-D-arabino-heptulosonate 7-phosphate (DAHP) synthase
VVSEENLATTPIVTLRDDFASNLLKTIGESRVSIELFGTWSHPHTTSVLKRIKFLRQTKAGEALAIKTSIANVNKDLDDLIKVVEVAIENKQKVLIS